jgi:hypothetical protein
MMKFGIGQPLPGFALLPSTFEKTKMADPVG